MPISVADLTAELAALDPKRKQAMIDMLGDEARAPFYPNPGPQTEALLSKADILLFGGQASGGKSALMIGTAARNHTEALICRRQGVQLDGLLKFANEVCVTKGGWQRSGDSFNSGDGRTLTFAGLNEPDDWRKHAGIGRDFYGFDEAGEFLEGQIASLIGWARTTKPGQRVRVILASNPPRGGDGQWMLKWFAPWLDPLFPNPAADGELRWAVRRGKDDGSYEFTWVDGPGEHILEGEPYTAQSYTFIRSALEDNPYTDAGYRARLQNLPEPLRSQLLYGNFLAGQEDHEWQVYPSAWIDACFERYRALTPRRRRQIATATDIAMGGRDSMVVAEIESMDARFEGDGFIIPPLHAVPGVDVTKPSQVGQHILRVRRDGSDTSVDYTGGWGTGVKEYLEDSHRIAVNPIVFSAASGDRNKDGQFGFPNERSALIWLLREAMDPEGGMTELLAIAPDDRLKAEMQAVRYKYRGDLIVIESKEDIKKRLKASTDRLDAVAMVFSRRFMRAINATRAKHQGVDEFGGYTEQAPDDSLFDF